MSDFMFRRFETSRNMVALPSLNCIKRLEGSAAVERLERLERSGPRNEPSAAIKRFERFEPGQY